MYETDEARDHLIAKSPDCVHYCFQYGYAVENNKIKTNQPWYSKLKEWFFPSLQAYPLPPYSHTSKKYF
jgi:hypothetical protein